MPQKTNLNTNPYYDDFETSKNFHRVLFKPGFPVQARELTTIQSMLQNQIESFGNHFFKDGSVIIPGGVSYEGGFYAVKLNPSFLGNDVSLYLSQLVGKEIRGEVSQVKAVVRYYLPASQSDEGYETLYIGYRGGNDNNEFSPFIDGENLITNESVQYGNTSIPAGESFATTIDLDATAIGSACLINEGIYYIRGHFVRVDPDTLILDQYSDRPSYRIGLTISEEVVTAKADDSLYDNAKGFSNYSAPGADRLKISTVLSKKDLTDYDDKNFVEILRVIDGELKKIQDKTDYNEILDYLAKRTYEESGDYSVVPFEVDAENSLNDEIGTTGVYLQSQTTQDGNTPSDDLLTYKISPGKAYVRGYDIDTQLTLIDAPKPRTTSEVGLASIPFEMGSLLKVNNVRGVPRTDLNTDNTVDLYSKRKLADGSNDGSVIGKARIYSFNTANVPYENAASEWDLYLYDIQTYTSIELNEPLNGTQCPETSYIVGKNSSASGYATSAASSATITVYGTSGQFLVGEQITINGNSETPRSIKSVTTYNISDIKAVYQLAEVDSVNVFGWTTAFTADTVLDRVIPPKFTAADQLFVNGTIATCPGKTFDNIRIGSIIRFQESANSVETFNRISAISANKKTLTLEDMANVSQVCDGSVTSGAVVVPFVLGVPKIKNEENSFLYAKLGHENVASVDLSKTNLITYQQVSGKSTDGNGDLTVTISDTGLSEGFFEGFDVERYSVSYNNGSSIVALKADQVSFNTDSTEITIGGLLTNQTNVVVNVTVKKTNIRSKTKKYQRSRKLTVSKTNSNSKILENGLTKNSYFGLRVEDEVISLNTIDAVNLVAVYESLDQSDAVLDSLTFLSTLKLDLSAIAGEKVRGLTSGAIAQVVSGTSASTIDIVKLNQFNFEIGETVVYEESGIQAILQDITKGKYLDRTTNYRLDKGHRHQLLDYSRIIRESGGAPSRRLTVIFDRYETPSNDTGDIYTVNSYTKERYSTDIPVLEDGTRCSDIIDVRPQLADFDPTNTYSPFSFKARTSNPATNTNNSILSPNENTLIGYSYYLPRIDKLVLHKDGEFKLIQGTPELEPKEPNLIEDGMHVATMSLPAYLYNPDDVTIVLKDNRRYTMRDIGGIDNRVTNLEETTSLSLLEVDTKTLQIQDSDGLSRFKSGFFVDDFKTLNLVDVGNPDLKCTVFSDEKVLSSKFDYFTLEMLAAPKTGVSMDTLSYDTNYDLLDANIQKSGEFATLAYDVETWRNITQPLATRVENVNPFSAVEMEGNMTLSPKSDTWIRDIVINRGSTRFTWGSWNGTYLENVLMSNVAEKYMRSRNVQFYATGLQPFTQHFSFLDKNKSIDIIPKLIQISMVSGQFSVGETVDGFIGNKRVISFRVAKQNHKKGSYDNPSIIYGVNPYDSDAELPGYNSASTVLNVDLASLCKSAEGRYSGYIKKGVTLVGRSSNAEATVDSTKLISDDAGTVVGAFFLRDPNATPTPLVRIKTGTKIFRLTSSTIDESQLPSGYLVSHAEAQYASSGRLRTYETVRVTVRRPPPPPPPPPRRRRRGDPLAQTFTTDAQGGFIKSVDLWMFSKDLNINLFVEIRTVELGIPTNVLVDDGARVELTPSQVITSSDANDGAFTRAEFDAPIYLEPDTEYAVVLLAPQSINYNAWIARVGEKTVATSSLPNVESVIYSRQYTGGSLYKSQNGTVWTPSQFEDLKFRMNRCNFGESSGTLYLYNPSLQQDSSFSDGNVYNTVADPIKTLPRKLIVGVNTSTTLSTVLEIGTKVGVGNTVYGFIENLGGQIASSNGLDVTNTGSNYKIGTYNNVPLYSESGNGTGATATVLIGGDFNVDSITITNQGDGYITGDVLGITTSSVGNVGSGARITVSDTTGVNTLYLTDVQGETFKPTASTPLVYYSGSTRVSMASTFVQRSEVLNSFYEGNVIEIFDHNHAMHSVANKVTLSNVFPTTVPVKIDAPISGSSNQITVDNVGIFTTFENRAVSIANTGYAFVGNEVIAYTSTGTNTLEGITRGVNNSTIRSHATGDLIYKYELNDVSLTRINKTHAMGDNEVSVFNSNTIDSYYVTIDRTGKDSGFDQLSFTGEREVGGEDCSFSQNIQYSSITPQFNVFTPGNTNISAEIRTISGTSVDGTEVSFLDLGYEPVELNTENTLSSSRLVASHVNEQEYLGDLPRNKSLTLAIKMDNGGNRYLTPVVDLGELCTVVLGRNRLNKPFDNYANNSGANLLVGDPHSSIYISKRINIQNPATSLKVLLAAYRDASADFRVFYRLFKADSTEVDQAFIPFPGYTNLTDTDGDGYGDRVINPANNNGLSDKFVRASASNEFIEYQFTADDLDQFSGFQIKVVMNGEDESKPVKLKDLRVLALA